MKPIIKKPKALKIGTLVKKSIKIKIKATIDKIEDKYLDILEVFVESFNINHLLILCKLILAKFI
ncbi:hypothetical protein [Paraclostridium bifermentans]|jgi:hypothetical protein|uniref:hypothetical protein n=1 Tax=Paraclostridium bifermentans TaxID=1490 RepID=UPI000DF768B1|nr:hypothetical protein [Paraclostridium bifermentans]MDU3337544.1 hypothetical protein [Paraclostridium bifermentans]RDC48398.1 hypothetical protein DVA85_29130 [Acinetobacter sp. RIT592]